MIHSTPIDPNNPLTNSTVKNDTNVASTYNHAACQPGQYAVNASARIVPPAGDFLIGSLHDTSVTVTFSASDCGGGGGGGGRWRRLRHGHAVGAWPAGRASPRSDHLRGVIAGPRAALRRL